MVEVYRAGIESIPRGQMEAAARWAWSRPGDAVRDRSPGDPPGDPAAPQRLHRLMKDTSLVSVISLAEVVHVGRDVYSTTFNPSALTLGAIMFLIVTCRWPAWLTGRSSARTEVQRVSHERRNGVPERGCSPRGNDPQGQQPEEELVSSSAAGHRPRHQRRGVICVLGRAAPAKEHHAALPEPARITDRRHDRAEGRHRLRRDQTEELDDLRRETGMVFQSFNLFPNMSAKENVSIAQGPGARRKKADADKRSIEQLTKVGLAEKRLTKYPDRLSGGQQQQVAIARPGHGPGSDAL